MVSPAQTLERRIRAKLRHHLLSAGFEETDDGHLRPPQGGKPTIRSLHALQRIERLRDEGGFISDIAPQLLDAFASGHEVDPLSLSPRLELVDSGTWEAQVFRLAALLWSVPVSRGYGRRLRFLVWDDANDKVIGIIALGDPAFNLAARDTTVGWTSADRKQRLVNMMDAFILGAVPPYNMLLGSKLVACLVRSREVVEAFRARYSGTTGIISRERKSSKLVAVTTTSALGRSSVYNRLALDGIPYFNRIGFTGGWGHFHVPRDLFEDIRKYLALQGHPYARGYEYGQGPNWRLRTIRAALDLMHYDADLLRHGVRREVFISWTADNALEILNGHRRRADFTSLRTVEEIGGLARDRWLIPRAKRRPEFRDWDNASILGAVDWRAVAAARATDASA